MKYYEVCKKCNMHFTNSLDALNHVRECFAKDYVGVILTGYRKHKTKVKQ